MINSISQFLTDLLAPTQGHLSFFYAIAAMAIAYLGGILSSLTPCVYPMIPITVSVVGGMGKTTRHWKEIFLRGMAYVAGMTVIYSFLGVIAGASGRVFGSMTNGPSWYLGLSVIMTLSALVMLDVIPFDPVVWWDQIKRNFHLKRSRGQAAHENTEFVKKEVTLFGAFFLGASSGFIAAPCTTPVLTAILAFIANTRSIGLGFLLMFSFSLGLGTLLLVIAAFTGALQILPRSGQWLKTIKVVSGLILLAFGEYLIYRAGCFGGP